MLYEYNRGRKSPQPYEKYKNHRHYMNVTAVTGPHMQSYENEIDYWIFRVPVRLATVSTVPQVI